MGFLAGFSFISRFSKHILDQLKIFKHFDDQYHANEQKVKKLKEDIHNAFSKAVGEGGASLRKGSASSR